MEHGRFVYVNFLQIHATVNPENFKSQYLVCRTDTSENGNF
jgi:hypothetical protein